MENAFAYNPGTNHVAKNSIESRKQTIRACYVARMSAKRMRKKDTVG